MKSHYSKRDKLTILTVLQAMGEQKVRRGLKAFDVYESACESWARCFMARAFATKAFERSENPEKDILINLGNPEGMGIDDIAHVVWAFDEAPELLKEVITTYLNDRQAISKLISETAASSAA
jgi:hypothetical protein